MVKLAEYPRTATFAWSYDKIPQLVTGTASGTIDEDFSNDSTLELWSLLATDPTKPISSLKADAKFNDLDWSVDNKLIAGAFDNGFIELFSNDKNSLKSIGKFNKHKSAVKTLKFNNKQPNVLVTGDNKGEILIWDTNKCVANAKDYSPMLPGTAMTPMEEIQSLAWNQSLAHVFASAGSTSYASIWDLKAKKEVIHLSYTSPTTGLKPQLSVVEWHPTNSTRVATATGSDTEPMILVWDLRNANTPLQILSNGHSKGIISMDWCKQDDSLLLSSGRDNTVLLWNPDTSEKLSQFPTRSNWCFKTKFAPAAPDIFATASFDSKIEVQTLQNLVNTLDEKQTENKRKESESDFWNHVSQDESDEKPTVVKLQAPNWYGNKSPAAHWAFGGKLIKINPDGKSISIVQPKIEGQQDNTLLAEALKSNDFKPLINVRLVKNIDKTNEEDWSLLEKLSMDGKDEFLKDAFSFDDDTEETESNAVEGEEFFEKIENKFEPSGSFKLSDGKDETISKKLISGKLQSAVSEALENDLLLESLIVALDSNDQSLKDSVKNAYFTKYGNKSSLSRVLYSTSKKDVEDMIENLDISQWKFTVKAIYNFYKDNEALRNESLVKLGDRLLEGENRQDALVLYLAANSIDKVAAIWLKEFTSSEEHLKKQNKTVYEAHSECLSEFIERFTVFSSFIGSSKITNEELISKFLEYVNLASASGNFDLAIQFLDTLPGDNEQVNTEKERVYLASGKSLKPTQTTKQNKYSTASLSTAPAAPAYGAPQIPPTTAAPVPFYGAQPGQRMPSVSTTAAKSNPYAPVNTGAPIVTPAPFAQPAPAPTSSFIPPANPYSNTMAAQTTPQQNAYAPINPNPNPIQPSYGSFQEQNTSVVPPPPTNGVMSGQKPHLNKKANDGWNDLPLKVKEKPSRAKAVSVAPASIGSSPQPPIGNIPHRTVGASGSVPPPPPLSRVTSSASYSPNAARISRKSSVIGEVPKQNNPYAPQAKISPVVSPATNPYAPPPVSEALPSVNNPYAPAPLNAPVPVSGAQNPYAPSGQPVSMPATNSYTQPPVAPAANVSAGPPPTNIKRKTHKAAQVESAAGLLESVQSKPSNVNLAGTSASTVTAPPSSVAPPVSATSPIASTAAATPAVAVGIPPEQQPIVDFLKSELERVTPLIPSEYTKQLKDCQKRLKILFQHLEKQDLLTQPTIDKLHELVSLLKEKKYSEAMQVHVDIATNHASEGGNWLTGIRRLIGIAEATSS